MVDSFHAVITMLLVSLPVQTSGEMKTSVNLLRACRALPAGPSSSCSPQAGQWTATGLLLMLTTPPQPALNSSLESPKHFFFLKWK